MNERGTRRDKPMKPQVVTYHLNKLLENDAIISADSGHDRNLGGTLHRHSQRHEVFSLRHAGHDGQRSPLLHRGRRALQCGGPAVVDALVDKNEPPLPGRIKLEQAIHFAEALAKGERHAKLW